VETGVRTAQAELHRTETPAASRSGAGCSPGARSALCEGVNAHPRAGAACGTPTHRPRGSQTTLAPNRPEDLTFTARGVSEQTLAPAEAGTWRASRKALGRLPGKEHARTPESGDGGSETVPVVGSPAPAAAPGPRGAGPRARSRAPRPTRQAGGLRLFPRARYSLASGD